MRTSSVLFTLLIYNFIYLFIACAGSSLLLGLFSSSGEWVCSSLQWLLIMVASLMKQALGHVGLSSCCIWAQWLRLPGPI